MTTPATLGRGLGRSFALASVIGMVVFGVIVAAVIYGSELGDQTPEDPPLEIAEQVMLAFALALPCGVVLSLLIGRRLTRTTTGRLDDVIDSASRMSGERLDERLPVGAAHDPLDHLAEVLNALLARIEAGVAAQREFAADASHELRTPLAVISTNLEVGRRKPRDVAHWEQVVDTTLAEVKRMHQMLDKLLALSRAGAAGLHHERCELRPLAAAAVERAGALASEHDVTVALAEGSEIDADIDSDAMAIVLDNLLRNAIDHSPKGEPVVCRVESGPRLVVDDHGPGVPVESRERIFEPFARGVHRDTDRAVGSGVGLGLAICKRIVAGHRGEIHVEDRPGGGARFVVTLPLHPIL